MEKFVLLPSVQGGPFNNQSRYIDLEIPSQHIVNMQNSFIQLECMIAPETVASIDSTLGSFVMNLIVANQASNLNPMNVDLIRNAWILSDAKGKLEDIRRVNVLSHNLLELTKTSAENRAMPETLFQLPTYDYSKRMSPFTELYKIGSTKSVLKPARLKIPLSHLFQLGNLQMFDTGKFGTTRIHLELDNLDYMQVAVASLVRNDDKAFDNTTAIGSSLSSTKTYGSQEDIPWFVGEKVLITYTKPATTNPSAPAITIADEAHLITSISNDPTTKKVSLTFESGMTFPSNTTAISIKEFIPTAGTYLGTFKILTAQIGLSTIDGAKSPDMGQFEYTTFTTEEFSTAGQQYLDRIFEVEPECINTLLFFTDPSAPYKMVSNNHLLSTYRLRVDGQDVYDRDVYVNYNFAPDLAVPTHDPAHVELLNRTFANGGLSLKNLTCVSLDPSQTELAARFTSRHNQIMIVATPTPQTALTKKYQVNLTASEAAGIKSVILFKQVVKVLNL
jgi:hypothetical protein